MSTESTRVGVVGLGYVGLPLALALHRAGHEVVGVDTDEGTVDALRDGETRVSDVDDAEVASALSEGIEFTSDYGRLSDVDGVSVCVPTPLGPSNAPDLSYVTEAAERLADVLPSGSTVILESTVYPGATEEVVAERLTQDGWKIGEDVFVAFSPERIDPGNDAYSPTDIPKVLGGVTAACGDRAQALYEPVFDQVVRVESALEAELVKLLENTFRAINIGYINEFAQIAHELDADIWNVIGAAETKPFGFMPFYPGPGIGGTCIPIDPFYLIWKADQEGIETRFLRLADTVNEEMPDYVVDRVARELNERGVAMSTADVLVVGGAYKPDVSDPRESPAIEVIEGLEDWGAAVHYHDPFVPTLRVGDDTYESQELTAEVLESVDCVVVVTNHSTLDVEWITEHASLVFDTRNATADIEAASVVRL